MRGKYAVVSGFLFALIAIIQSIRALAQWPIQVASLQIPVWLSWVAAAVTASLSFWAFRSRA